VIDETPEALCAKAQAGDEEAKDRLCRRFLGLVRNIAMRIPWGDADEKFSAGCLGLVRAARCFNGMGAFGAYAAIRIRGAIFDDARAVGFSSFRRKRNGACGQPRPAKDVPCLSLAQPVARGWDDEYARTVGDILPGPEPDWPDDRLYLEALLARLPRRDAHILTRYYMDGESMATIGRELRISESRVSQLRLPALERARALAGCDSHRDCSLARRRPHVPI